MLRRIGLTNFKCFEKLDLPCASLNLLCGLNGMGKSSVIQALLVLRQSFETGDLQEGRLVLGGAQGDARERVGDEQPATARSEAVPICRRGAGPVRVARPIRQWRAHTPPVRRWHANGRDRLRGGPSSPVAAPVESVGCGYPPSPRRRRKASISALCASMVRSRAARASC